MDHPTFNRGWSVGQPRILHFPQHCCQHDISTPAHENWVWSVSHPPANPQSPAPFDQVTRLPPENASFPLEHSDALWPNSTVWQVSIIQYLFVCQKSQRSINCNMPPWLWWPWYMSTNQHNYALEPNRHGTSSNLLRSSRTAIHSM